jgi:hypothetical protein
MLFIIELSKTLDRPPKGNTQESVSCDRFFGGASKKKALANFFVSA